MKSRNLKKYHISLTKKYHILTYRCLIPTYRCQIPKKSCHILTYRCGNVQFLHRYVTLLQCDITLLNTNIIIILAMRCHMHMYNVTFLHKYYVSFVLFLSHFFIDMLHSYIDLSQFLKRCCILKCRDNTLSYSDAI